MPKKETTTIIKDLSVLLPRYKEILYVNLENNTATITTENQKLFVSLIAELGYKNIFCEVDHWVSNIEYNSKDNSVYIIEAELDWSNTEWGPYLTIGETGKMIWWVYYSDPEKMKKYSDKTQESKQDFVKIVIKQDEKTIKGKRVKKKPVKDKKYPAPPEGIFIPAEQYHIIESAYNIKKPVLLMWETGCGKTTIIKALAKKHKHELTRINLTGETSKEDLIGYKTLVGGNVEWVDWPLTIALRKGHIILLDEINAALPEVLLIIQALTESYDNKLWELFIPEINELIVPHQDTRIFGTANPSDNYIWAKEFNPATLSRWFVLYIEYLDPEEEKELLKLKFEKQFKNKNKSYIYELFDHLVELAKTSRDKYRNKEITYMCSTRDIEQVVELCILEVDLTLAITVWVLNKVQDPESREIVKRAFRL